MTMRRQSPPKHRHDGTSPLPLGMDWSPPPRIWAGRESVWPNDPRTGWSYCVTVPSWVVLAKSRDSDPTVEILQEERERNEQIRTSWRKLLRKCKILQDQCHECNINNLMDLKGDNVVDSIPSLLDPFDIVGTSDNHIDLLIAEVQHLALDVSQSSSTTDKVAELDDHVRSLDEELRQTLTTILVDNGVLRKQVNTLLLHALKMKKSTEKVDIDCISVVDVDSEVLP